MKLPVALVALLLPAAVAAGLSLWAFSVVGKTPPETPLAAGSVFWAERVFTERQDFSVWLAAHGAKYRTWAARHPRAAARQRAAARSAARRVASPNG